MPVTAKLSRKFYEALGDDIANELVEWFNQVDATYRADLRELNELNFARFEASMKQQMAELAVKLDQHISGTRTNMTELETRLDRRITSTRADLIKWMFAFWIGTLAPLAGLIILLTR